MPWLSTLVKEFVMSHGGIKVIWLYYVLIRTCVSERIQFQHYSAPYLILDNIYSCFIDISGSKNT